MAKEISEKLSSGLPCQHQDTEMLALTLGFRVEKT